VCVTAAIDGTKLNVGEAGRPMALELMVDGDMEEDEEVVVQVDKRVVKGKQRDQGNRDPDQPTERENRLQIIVGSTSDSDHFLQRPFPPNIITTMTSRVPTLTPTQSMASTSMEMVKMLMTGMSKS
jgi:hypothetical protein